MARLTADEIKAALDRAREAIKSFAQSRGISPSEWQGEAGLGQGTLSKFLRGIGTTRDIGLAALLRLASQQDATVAEIIGETPSPPTNRSPINRHLLAEAIAAIEARIAKTGEKIEPTDKAVAILIVYDAASRRDGAVSIEELVANVTLLASRKR